MSIHRSQRSKYALALALAALLSPVAGRAAGESATASSPAKARLIQPLTITLGAGRAVEFGVLIKNTLTAPVTIVLDPRVSQSASITSSNPAGVTSISVPSSSSPAAASFTVTGEPDETIQVALPASILIKKGAGGTAATEMTVSNFNADAYDVAGSPNLHSDVSNQFTMPTDGSAILEVGGTLTVDPADEFGDYVGTFNVTVSYV